MAIAAAPLGILLIEDNPSDARLMLEALRDSEFDENVRIARDGVDAMLQLRDESQALPDLILLDLNLPRKDGREVLDDIKRDKLLRHIPVVVLSTSRNEQDVRSSYEHGANAFLSKPTEMEDLYQTARVLRAFWTEAKLWRP